jgi:hypothetical protein
MGAILALLACSRQATPRLHGQVLDDSGRPIAGAKLVVRNEKTAETAEGTADESGTFSFPSLAPGKYTVTAEKSGFAKSATEMTIEDTSDGTTGQNPPEKGAKVGYIFKLRPHQHAPSRDNPIDWETQPEGGKDKAPGKGAKSGYSFRLPSQSPPQSGWAAEAKPDAQDKGPENKFMEVHLDDHIAAPGATITLQAKVTDQFSGKPVVGRALQFFIEGELVTANPSWTNSSGIATRAYRYGDLGGEEQGDEFGPGTYRIAAYILPLSPTDYPGVKKHYGQLRLIKGATEIKIDSAEFKNPNSHIGDVKGHSHFGVAARLFRKGDGKGLALRKVSAWVTLAGNTRTFSLTTQNDGVLILGLDTSTLSLPASASVPFGFEFEGEKLYLGYRLEAKAKVK